MPSIDPHMWYVVGASTCLMEQVEGTANWGDDEWVYWLSHEPKRRTGLALSYTAITAFTHMEPIYLWKFKGVLFLLITR